MRTQPPVFAAAQPATSLAVNAVAASSTPVSELKVAATAPTVRIQHLREIDPAFALRLSAIPGFGFIGVERSGLDVPISPNGEFTETTVLEDPKDASKKYFIMGYAVLVEHTSRGQQYAVRLFPKGSAWELTLSLVKSPPAEILRANPGATELPHDVALLLRYKQRVNGQPSAVSELAFTSVTLNGDQVRGVLAIDSLPKRNEIYAAMTDSELACNLVVRRKAQVAVPVPQDSVTPKTRPELVMAAPLIIRDHRARIPIERSSVPAGTNPPPAPRFRRTERVSDQSIPFCFDPALNAQVFEGLGTMTHGGSQGLLRRVIDWNGQPHIYYQDDGARNVFYYLPDTLKIARRPAAPHEPLMSVRFDSEDGSKERMQVTVAYCAVPWINRERLAAAVASMQSLVPADILAASPGIELEPLLPDPSKMVLKLAAPGSGVAGGPFTPRPGAAVDLRSGIVDALTMNVEQFRALFDAMFSRGQLLFSGSVEFDLGGTSEQIPFQLRFHNLAEPFARWNQSASGDDVALELINEIESSLRIQHLDAIIGKDGTALVKPAEPASGSYPVDIVTGGAARFQVQQAGGPVQELDFSEVECVPDREAVYNLILDPSTVPAYLREIKVKTFKPTFFELPATPQNQIMSVVVDFEGGISVELTADTLEATVKVPVPLTGFILGREEALQYRFKVTVARLSGATTDKEWRSGESGVLFPPIA
jgi:hypothetical protein